jgi:hypothetical protein
VEHAAAVRDGVRGLDAEAVADAADGLVALARCTDPVDVRKRLRDKAHAINDRLAAAAERRARQRMGLRLSDVGSHTAVDGTLAGADGATVRLAMDLAVEADRHAGDQRGKAARQADVLVGWATDYLQRQGAPPPPAARGLSPRASRRRRGTTCACTSPGTPPFAAVVFCPPGGGPGTAPAALFHATP